jgi:hypothetical protein
MMDERETRPENKSSREASERVFCRERAERDLVTRDDMATTLRKERTHKGKRGAQELFINEGVDS